MLTTHDLLQQTSHVEMRKKIPKPGKVFGGTGVAMSGILKLTRTYKIEKYHGTGCIYASQDYQRKPGLEITVLEGMIKFQKCEKRSCLLTRP